MKKIILWLALVISTCMIVWWGLDTIDNITKKPTIKVITRTTHNNYSDCELGDLVGEDVKRIRYLTFNIDYHSNDYKENIIKLFARSCARSGVKNQFEMDCCMSKKMFPQKTGGGI